MFQYRGKSHLLTITASYYVAITELQNYAPAASNRSAVLYTSVCAFMIHGQCCGMHVQGRQWWRLRAAHVIRASTPSNSSLFAATLMQRWTFTATLPWESSCHAWTACKTTWMAP